MHTEPEVSPSWVEAAGSMSTTLSKNACDYSKPMPSPLFENCFSERTRTGGSTIRVYCSPASVLLLYLPSEHPILRNFWSIVFPEAVGASPFFPSISFPSYIPVIVAVE